MAFFAIYPALGSGGGGGGGITSINGDTTAAQVIAGGTGISVSTVAGTTTITNTSNFTPGNLTDAGTDGIVITGGTNAVNGAGTSIAQHVADATHNGYLSQTDWSTFNNKQAALTLGNLTDAGTDGIVITGGTGAVVGAGTSIAQHVADATHNGYLSSVDWSTFNGKGNGTVTSVSVTTANGVSGVVATATTTPAITLTLGAITPSSVAATGTVTGLNLSGTNTGDQTITLTGDVTGSGTGSFATTLAATTNATITTLSGLTTATSLASIGTITTGTWNGTTIAINHGGTGQVTAGAAFDALSPLTTKGDIVVFSTTNTRQPVGTDGQVLIADSGQATGLSWSSLSTPPNASVYLNTSQSGLAQDASTKVLFDTAEFDVGGYFDLVTNNRYLPLVAGKYQISWAVTMESSGTNQIQRYSFSTLFKNGGAYKIGTQYDPLNNGNYNTLTSTGSALVAFDGVTDYVEVFARVFTLTGDTWVIVSGAVQTYFTVVKVSN